jgi:hypothetical protein
MSRPQFLLSCLLAGVLLAAACRPARAGGKPAPLPPDLDLIPREGVFVSVRVADLWRSDVFAPLRDKTYDLGAFTRTLPLLEQMLGVKLTDVERATLYCGGASPVLVVRCYRPIDRDRLRHAEQVKFDGPERKLNGRPYYVRESDWAGLFFPDERTVVYAPVKSLEAFLEARKKAADGFLLPALRAAAGSQVTFAARVPDGFPQMGQSVLAAMPATRSWGLEPLLATRSVLVTADFHADARLRVALTFAGPDPAARAEKVVRGLRRRALTAMPDFREGLADCVPGALPDGQEGGEAMLKVLLRATGYLKTVEDGLRKAEVHRDGARLDFSLRLAKSRGFLETLLLVQVVAPMLEAVEVRTEGVNPAHADQLLGTSPDAVGNLGRLGAAMLKYHEKHGHLPPAAVFDRAGRPLLSWRVLLLPELGEEELFKQFHLDEPWDGPRNKKLIGKMPRVFASHYDGSRAPTTHYQVFVGKGAAFEGTKGLRLADFRDDPAQTILVAEANVPVPWTKPQDLPFTPGGPPPLLGRFARMTAAFADGKARIIESGFDSERNGQDNPPARFDEKALRALITRSGGEPARPVVTTGGPERINAKPSQSPDGGVLYRAPADPALSGSHGFPSTGPGQAFRSTGQPPPGTGGPTSSPLDLPPPATTGTPAPPRPR